MAALGLGRVKTLSTPRTAASTDQDQRADLVCTSFWRCWRQNQVLNVSGRSYRVGRLLGRRSTARTYASIAVISDLTPMMFMTRVKL